MWWCRPAGHPYANFIGIIHRMLKHAQVTIVNACALFCNLQVLAHGKAVLGYTVLGPVALLLLAEAVRVSGVLPGGHEIKTVVQSKWHRINLQVSVCLQSAAAAAAS